MAFERKRTIQGLTGVIDVGTSKVCCLITAPDADGRQALLGFGHQRSLGLKAGTIIDMEAAERDVRAAVSQAERMAGVSLSSVVVAAVCGRPKSSSFMARAEVAGSLVTGGDVGRVLQGAETFVERDGRVLVQLLRSDWRLDGAKGIGDPRGLAGRELAVDITAVTADEAPLRNLLSVIERCHLTVDAVCASPLASASSVASSEEQHAGVLVVDIGAGVTSLAAFAEGRLVHADAIAVAGHHITYDIARALVTPVAEAERIKTLYGTLVKAASDQAELISFPVAGEDEAALFQTSKARLREIIEPRIEQWFGLVQERLQRSDVVAFASGRVILTGGGSQLIGLDRAWTGRFGGHVRIGRPKPIGRMPASACSPAFATAIGLALGETTPGLPSSYGRRASGLEAGYLGRMRQWITESF